MGRSFFEDNGALMDRANLIRLTLRWVVLASLLMQATTPDVLDLSLLSQSLPPGPILAASNLVATMQPSEDELPEGDSFSLEEWLRPGLRGEDGEPEDLCAPFWPEMGVMRKPCTSPWQCPNAWAPRVLAGQSFAAHSLTDHASSPQTALPLHMRCRLTC
jgi:hypothetical protein